MIMFEKEKKGKLPEKFIHFINNICDDLRERKESNAGEAIYSF